MSERVRVALFGASERGRQCLDELRETARVEVVCFFDNAPGKWGTTWHGVPVVRPLPERCDDVDAIVIATVHVGAVFAQVRRLGAGRKVALSPADLRRRLLKPPAGSEPAPSAMAPASDQVRVLASALGRRSAPSGGGDGAQIACTICCNNYLAFATVLVQSYLAHHPGDRFVICLADRMRPDVTYPDDPRVEVLEATSLGIADFDALAFRYTTIEFTTAIKPFLLQHLLAREGVHRVAYLDPDILVCDTLDTLYEPLRTASIALVPHILSPLDDERSPSEIDILRAGTFNLGVIGVSAGGDTSRFLEWWGRRLRLYCTTEVEKGLFTDQKWIDLVPSLFPRHVVVHDPGLDVAYWNLHERVVGVEGAHLRVGALPLRFFHFSGIAIDDLDAVSRHQNRHRLPSVGPLRLLFEAYRLLLVQAGHAALSMMTPHYACFDDGTPIPAAARHMYRSAAIAARFPRPFATGPQSFLDWLQSPVSPQSDVSQLFAGIHAASADLQRAFPDAVGADAMGLITYIVAAADLYGLSPRFLDAACAVNPDDR